jgi:hypothetical protein
VEWVGYKVHQTETCDEEMPHLIVNVETTPATTPDDNMIEEVHESLDQRDLLPGEHLVDTGIPKVTARKTKRWAGLQGGAPAPDDQG